jgi:transcriptional regulator with XRE-family HTH domain
MCSTMTPLPAAPSATSPVGAQLREWRQRRRLSQLDLATDAEISTRHLSYVETGRALPSREMLIHLAETLEVPLRERNAMLTAAGYAPMYRERPLADPALAAARRAVDLVLKGHEPYPALAVDRHWTLLAHNRAVAMFLDGVGAALLARLRLQVAASADRTLAALLDELAAYPSPGDDAPSLRDEAAGVAVPLSVRGPDGAVLSFISTTTVFGTPVDITLSELALETFFPADEATAHALRRLGDGQHAPAGA